MNFFKQILTLCVVLACHIAYGEAVNASTSVKPVIKEEDIIIIEDLNKTLLDTQKDASHMWNIETKPEKYQLKYFDVSDQIDLTYLNVTPEFGLAPFKGVNGVWVFAHTVRFGDQYTAYFTKKADTEFSFFDKIEIRAYLHGDATLVFFNNSDTTNVTATFSGIKLPGWQLFEIATNKIRGLRLEIHTKNYGDFGFLDKVMGYYSEPGDNVTTANPNPTTTKNPGNGGTSPPTGPTTTTIRPTTSRAPTTIGTTTTTSPTAYTQATSVSDFPEEGNTNTTTTTTEKPSPPLPPPSNAPVLEHTPMFVLLALGVIMAAT